MFIGILGGILSFMISIFIGYFGLVIIISLLSVLFSRGD